MGKWMPTRKWWAQTTGGLASIAASWIVSGAFDDVERGMAATLLVAAVASYWTPNAKRVRARRAHVDSNRRRS